MISEWLKSFLRSWKNNSTVHLATIAVLTGTFSVVTMFVSIYENLDQLLTHWGEEVQMTAFLNDDIDMESLNQANDLILGQDFVRQVNYVSKDQAVETFLSQMGSFAPDLLEDKDFSNPLPASFDIQLADGMSQASSYEKLVNLAAFVKKLPGVDDVSYGQGWVENYSSLVNQFGNSSWMIIFVLLSGSLLIVGNAIKNSIFARRDEIEVLELVGATPGRIRGPFLFEGAVLGLSSSVLAIVICYGLFTWQSHAILGELNFLGLSAELNFLSLPTLIGLPVFGTAIGCLGAFICVRKISTGWAAAERSEQW